jgi:hypothetical protein
VIEIVTVDARDSGFISNHAHHEVSALSRVPCRLERENVTSPKVLHAAHGTVFLVLFVGLGFLGGFLLRFSLLPKIAAIPMTLDLILVVVDPVLSYQSLSTSRTHLHFSDGDGPLVHVFVFEELVTWFEVVEPLGRFEAVRELGSLLVPLLPIALEPALPNPHLLGVGQRSVKHTAARVGVHKTTTLHPA